MVDYDRELNDEQRRVVLAQAGPLLVIAGAGSGKTRTLTYRVAHLIEVGVHPGEIVLATFTNKAAKAMLARVHELAARDISALWGGTFHHICHQLLRRHSKLIGYPTNFSIMDSEDARQLLQACLADFALHTRGENFPAAALISDIIGLAVNTETPLAELIVTRYPHFAPYTEDIVRVALAYQHRKESLGLMDFDDLLRYGVKLLSECDEVRERYAERFRHILVDEYQDTSLIQARLIDLLALRHRNLMVVGDDSQSIYSFRGANFENILRFPEKYSDCLIFKLETNYRSTPEILQLANLSIGNNTRRFRKVLQATKGAGVRPIMVEASTASSQAQFVVQRIIELVRSGTALDEIAVLYRAHYHCLELQMELVRQNVPFAVRSGIRFFEQAHIKDVVAYLRVTVNPRDELAWKRLFGMCSHVGKAMSQKLWQFLARQQDPLAAALGDSFLKVATAAARPALETLQHSLRAVAAPGMEKNPADALDAILAAGYRDHLCRRYPDAASRKEDVQRLAQLAACFANVADFLGELALMANMTEEEEDHTGVTAAGRVVLSTIHQAKGLEWSVVFLLWCADGMIPLTRALQDQAGEEEERRLFYVATTRAKDQLYLCYPRLDRSRGMRTIPLRPSRFLRELPSPYDEDRCPYEVWDVEED